MVSSLHTSGYFFVFYSPDKENDPLMRAVLVNSKLIVDLVDFEECFGMCADEIGKAHD